MCACGGVDALTHPIPTHPPTHPTPHLCAFNTNISVLLPSCRVLGDLERLLRTQDTPADHAAAYEFVLRRANILYACGKSVSAALCVGGCGVGWGGGVCLCLCPALRQGPVCLRQKRDWQWEDGQSLRGVVRQAVTRTQPPVHTAEALSSLHLQEAYLDVTLPVLGATLRTLEAEHRQVRLGGWG